MLRKFLAIFCVAAMATSFVACSGPGEVTTTPEAERNIPLNTDVPEDDPNSGVNTGFE